MSFCLEKRDVMEMDLPLTQTSMGKVSKNRSQSLAIRSGGSVFEAFGVKVYLKPFRGNHLKARCGE